jgi:hypothetical protein
VIGDASGGRRQPTPWRIAPVSQRMLAGLVDGGVLALVGLWGSGIRRRRGVERRRGSSVLPVALDAAYGIGLTALAGNTLGQVTVRIRVVHQDPGTVPTWRQAALRWAVAAPPALAPGLVPMPRSAKRWMSRAEQLQPRIEELHRKHGHDRQRFNEELLALYQGEGLSPAAGLPCRPPAGGGVPCLRVRCLPASLAPASAPGPPRPRRSYRRRAEDEGPRAGERSK